MTLLKDLARAKITFQARTLRTILTEGMDMTDNLEQGAKGALKALDGFMSGAEMTAEQKDLQHKVTMAGSFAAAAYDHHSPQSGGEYHALTRAFLLALIDPLHPDLDYLRSVPKAGKVLRDERASAGGKVT